MQNMILEQTNQPENQQGVKPKEAEPVLNPTEIAETPIPARNLEIQPHAKEEEPDETPIFKRKRIKKEQKQVTPLENFQKSSRLFKKLTTVEKIEQYIQKYKDGLAEEVQGKRAILDHNNVLKKFFKSVITNIIIQKAIPLEKREELLREILTAFDIKVHCRAQTVRSTELVNKARITLFNSWFDLSIAKKKTQQKHFFRKGNLYLALYVKEFSLFSILFDKCVEIDSSIRKPIVTFRKKFQSKLRLYGTEEVQTYYREQQAKLDEKNGYVEDKSDDSDDSDSDTPKKKRSSKKVKLEDTTPLLPPMPTVAPKPQPTTPILPPTVALTTQPTHFLTPNLQLMQYATVLRQHHQHHHHHMQLHEQPRQHYRGNPPAMPAAPTFPQRLRPGTTPPKVGDTFAARFINNEQNTHRESIHHTASKSLTDLYLLYYGAQHSDPTTLFRAQPDLINAVIQNIFDHYIDLAISKYSKLFIDKHLVSFVTSDPAKARMGLSAIFNDNLVAAYKSQIRQVMQDLGKIDILPPAFKGKEIFKVLRALHRLNEIFHTLEIAHYTDPKSKIDTRLAFILGWKATEDEKNLISIPGTDISQQKTELRNVNFLDAIINGIGHCPSGYINDIPNSLYQCHQLISMKHFIAEDLPVLIKDKYNAYYQALDEKKQMQIAHHVARNCLGNEKPLAGFLYHEQLHKKFTDEMSALLEAKCFTPKQLEDNLEEIAGDLNYIKKFFPILNKNFETIRGKMLTAYFGGETIDTESTTATAEPIIPPPAALPRSPKSPRLFQLAPPLGVATEPLALTIQPVTLEH